MSPSPDHGWKRTGAFSAEPWACTRLRPWKENQDLTNISAKLKLGPLALGGNLLCVIGGRVMGAQGDRFLYLSSFIKSAIP